MGVGLSLEKFTTAKARAERSNENKGLGRPERQKGVRGCLQAGSALEHRQGHPAWEVANSNQLTLCRSERVHRGRTGPILEAQPEERQNSYLSVTEILRQQLPVLLL